MRCWFAGVLVIGFLAGGRVRAEAPAAMPAEQLIELGKKIEGRVSKLRGLPVKKPIRWEVTSKEKVRAYLLQALSDQYAAGELEDEADAYKVLGLIPRNLNYKDFMVALLEEQVGGYYDPKKETFYLADWIGPALQESIISHELTHALQDQNFDIKKFTERIRGNSDAMVARSALVEGEATLVMMLDAMGGMGMQVDLSTLDLDGPLGKLMMTLSESQMPAMAKAPRAIKEIMLFPYIKGLSFVVAGRKSGGWDAISKVYGDLPASTEQVLHPAKYFTDRDRPVPVAVDFLAEVVAGGWKPIYDDVLGEFMIQQVLLDLPADERKKAAAGWGGDHLRVYRRGEELAFVSLSEWDSEADAGEFAGAFAKTVLARARGYQEQPLTKAPQMIWKGEGNRVIWLEKQQKRVLLVFQLEAATVAQIRAKAFNAPAR